MNHSKPLTTLRAAVRTALVWLACFGAAVLWTAAELPV